MVFPLTALLFPNQDELTLFDFTKMDSVDNWVEISDTKRIVGKSKATLVLQTTKVFQNAIFFSLLNPQPNGACFAGMSSTLNADLSKYKNIIIRCKAQGENRHYKIVLQHKKQAGDEGITYENFFELPVSDDDTFTDVKLVITEFEPYFRGVKQPTAKPLNPAEITSLGIQIFGGFYLDFKQSGASALTIENICATS